MKFIKLSDECVIRVATIDQVYILDKASIRVQSADGYVDKQFDSQEECIYAYQKFILALLAIKE